MKRYPSAPLCDALGLSFVEMAERVGLHGSQFQSVRRWGFNPDDADRFAVAAGLHPHEVWPEFLADQIEAERARQRALAAARKRRQRADPAARDADRARCAAYYAECREGLKAAARRRYWADPEKHRARKRRGVAS